MDYFRCPWCLAYIVISFFIISVNTMIACDFVVLQKRCVVHYACTYPIWPACIPPNAYNNLTVSFDSLM
jgi:hypothetical protein